MALFDPSMPDSSGGFSSGLMGGGFDVGSVLGALGQSLLTSTRQNPFQNFGTALQQADKQSEERNSRKALVAVLRQAGMSQEQAETYALNPLAAKLAIENQTAAKGEAAARLASGIMGGADSGVGTSPSGSTPPMLPLAPAGPAAGLSLNGPTGKSSEIQNKFVDALKAGGLTNPYGLGAVAAYAQHESRYSPTNITGSWSDPSESGQAGTSGGILSWRDDRLNNMREATKGAPDPVTAQAQFTLQENPDLTAALQNAKSPEEANALMAEAWKFAGYNRPGGEYAARLATTRSYASRFADGSGRTRTADVSGAVPVGSDVLAGFVPSTSDPYSSGPPTAQAPEPLSTGRASSGPVQIAENESEVQRLEGQMGMLPGVGRKAIRNGTAGVPAVAQADLPAPDAKEAEFRIPGDGGTSPVPAGTVFDDKTKAMQQLTRISQALAIPNLPEGTRRQLEAAREQATAILKPTDQTRKLIDAGYQPGTPEFQDAARRLTFGEKDDKDKIIGEARQREQIAGQYGLTKGAPGYSSFILTGKLPNEEKTGLTATDKKAIFEAENSIAPLESTIDTLKRAKELNTKTYTGYSAGWRGALGTSAPDLLVPDFIADPKTAAATREFGQIMSMEAIKSMSATLKGATTDREMDRFVEILGDPTTPPDIRARTIDRMTKLAEQQRELALDRVNELRGGTYFKPQGGAQQGQGRKQARPARSGNAAPSFSQEDLAAEARRRGLIP